MTNSEQSAVECLTFLRAAEAMLVKAHSCYHNLPKTTKQNLIDVKDRLCLVVHEAWEVVSEMNPNG